MKRIERIIKLSQEVGEILKTSTDPKIRAAHLLLHARLKDPKIFVTLVGETSSGKSTLINAVLKEQLLPTSSRPTTGTVTQVQFTNSKEIQFFAINRDASLESLDQEKFNYLSKTPDNELLRLYVEVSAPRNEFIGINIFDTPGYNSLLSKHEEVLSEFIPQSDIIIFLVNYRIGFNLKNQEMMNIISNVREGDDDLSVLLAINRCPPEITIENTRITEISNHAADTLHQTLKTFTIYSVFNQDDMNTIFPQAFDLWQEVLQCSLNAERMSRVEEKGKWLLFELIEKMILECESRLIAVKLEDDSVTLLEKEKQNLALALQKSLKIVEKHIDRLNRNLPRIINKDIDKLRGLINKDIFNSGKWLESASCSAFVTGHAIPFGVRQIIKKIDNYTEKTFEQMDEELSEMANRTIYSIKNDVDQIQSPDLANLLNNLALRLSALLVKNVAGNLVRGLGGVGGTAAGVGNLAKLMLSNMGKIVGKTFSREVYKQIGKTFSKKMLQRLSVGIAILIDGISFIVDANKWQGKLVEEVEKCIRQWEKDVIKELESVILPEYLISNNNLLNEIYKGFTDEIDRDIESIKIKFSTSKKAELVGYIKMLNEYKIKLEKI